MGGGLVLAAFGLVGGPGPWAQAAPAPAPSYRWCPGDPWDPSWNNVEDWDWNVCHEWQRPGGPSAPAGWGPWGPPPGWAPPRPPQPAWAPGANVMWDPLTGWGFFNAGIWTPI